MFKQLKVLIRLKRMNKAMNLILKEFKYYRENDMLCEDFIHMKEMVNALEFFQKHYEIIINKYIENKTK